MLTNSKQGSCEWQDGGAKSHDCHHLHVNVLLHTIFIMVIKKSDFFFFFLLNITERYIIYTKSKLYFLDIKTMSGRNGGDSVKFNNESTGIVLIL